MKKTPEPTQTRRPNPDLLCVLILFALTLAVYSPALFGGKVLLPADIIPLMRPWSASARERFPDFHIAQNQMHGPIFEYYSWRYYARERLRSGEVPLWNPYELGGNVLLANSQSAVLYPPNLLLYLFPLPTGINLVTALHTFLTGLFMYGLLRALALRPVAAVTGSLVWMFCGLQIVWTEFQTPTAALCWLPGALWAWERYQRTGAWRWTVLGSGGAVALALLAGHLQFAFYVITAFVLYAVWRATGERPARWSELGVCAGALAFGIGLSLCTMLPVIEMGRMNFRAGKTGYTSSIGLRLPPENLLTLLQPNLFGNPKDYGELDAAGQYQEGHPYWGKFDFIEYTFYMGIPGLLLGLIGVFPLASRPRGPRPWLAPRWFFACLAALGLLLALGTPVCALFFYLVPGYRQFNATARALALFSFGMAALAAFGLQALLEAAEQGRSRRAAWTLGIVGLAVAASGLAAFPGGQMIWPKLAQEHWRTYEMVGVSRFVGYLLGTMVAAGLLLWSAAPGNQQASSSFLTRAATLAWIVPVLAVADLLFWGAGFNPITDREMLGYPTQTTDFLRKIGPARAVSLETPGWGIKSFIVPNFNAVAGFREVQGADSLHTTRYHHLMERVVLAMEPDWTAAFTDPNTIHVPALTHPLFDLLNVRYFTTSLRQDVEVAGKPRARAYKPVLDAEMTVWQNETAAGPAWIVGRAEEAHGLDSMFTRLSAPGFDGRRTALLESAPPPLDPVAASGTATLTAFEPHRLAADVESPGRGLLVLSEIAFPGWRARIDGRPAPIYTADYILRAVPIPPGRHRVEMTYEPISYRLGLYLTCVAVGLAAASLACGIARQKPK